jgi:hypothetical protein
MIRLHLAELPGALRQGAFNGNMRRTAGSAFLGRPLESVLQESIEIH